MKREYEIGLIINPETADEEAEKIKTSITDILEKGKGTIENIDEWGRKALAYPIEKHKEGIYVFIKTMSPGDVIAAVERRLKLNEKVMRFIIIRLDDKFRKTNKLVKKWKRIEKFSKKPGGDIERDRPSERPAPRPKAEVPKVDTTATEPKAEVKVPKVDTTATEPKAEVKVPKVDTAAEVKVKETPVEKKAGEKVEKEKVEKAVTEPEAKEEKKVEIKEKATKKETVKKPVKKEKEVKEEKVEEAKEKPVKPKKAPAKKTTKKTEEKVEEEVENAETK